MIDKIYEVIKPTCFGYVSNDWWYTGSDIEFVMIWDVIHRMQQNIHLFDWNSVWYILSKIYSIPRWDFRKPIDEQTYECIQYVYNLIQDK